MANAKKCTDAERLARIKSGLQCSDEEAQEILAYDKAIDRDEKTEYDLPAEKDKIAKQFAHTGTRKTPTVYKFSTRKRKPNETKGLIVSAIAQFLRGDEQLGIENLEVPNPERVITFTIDGKSFELTLIQNRKKKEG